MTRHRERAPFQVLVIPYWQEVHGTCKYALFLRADEGYWQGVSGGGWRNESPLEAARRETQEETGLSIEIELLPLQSVATIPVVNVTNTLTWGPDVLVIPEYAFGVRCPGSDLVTSDEHTEYDWFSFSEAMQRLRWDSNRTALWELDYRLHQAGDVSR